MTTPGVLPGVRVGQLWRARTPDQRLPWLRIIRFDHPFVEGRLTGKRDSCGGREVRMPRDQVEVNYRLVSEPDATP